MVFYATVIKQCISAANPSDKLASQEKKSESYSVKMKRASYFMVKYCRLQCGTSLQIDSFVNTLDRLHTLNL